MKKLCCIVLCLCCCLSNAYAAKDECKTNGKDVANICSLKDIEKGKVDVCHVPPGCPENEHNICVSSNSVDKDGIAHSPGEHGGDYLGICKSLIDCAGVPLGRAVVDQCGVCGGDNSTCKDCAGTVNGSAQIDACGVCAGDGKSCLGCDGVLNSKAITDECGVCGGDNSTCKDCTGKVNGKTEIDECGVCGGQSNTCLDCTGVPNGNSKLDICGVCNGDGSTCPEKKVTICHLTDEGSVTITVDQSALPAHLEHGDSLGSCPSSTPTPSPTPECSPSPSPTPENTPSPTPTPVGPTPTPSPSPIPENTPSPTPTPEVPTPTPTPPVIDCAGVPNGSATLDLCGVCNGLNLCLDCSGKPNGGTLVDSCGVCNGPGGKHVSFKDRKKTLRKLAATIYEKKTVPYFAGARKCAKNDKLLQKEVLASKKAFKLFIETLNELKVDVEVCPGQCALVDNKKVIKKLLKINKTLYKYAEIAQHGARRSCNNTGPGKKDTEPLTEKLDKEIKKCDGGKVCHLE